MTEPDWLYALARREVRNMASYNAGLSSEAVRQRFALERIAKLGSNENHFGPSSRVIAAVTREAQHVGLYPDPECTELRLALAARLGVEGARLIFGNGSEDLLGIISRVFLDHGDQVVTVLPSFGLHLLYPQAVGAEVIGVQDSEQVCGGHRRGRVPRAGGGRASDAVDAELRRKLVPQGGAIV